MDDDSLLEEILISVPFVSPAAAVLRTIGAQAAMEVTSALRGRFKDCLPVEGSLSVWPQEVAAESLVFRARVTRAVLSASGGANLLADQILGMLEEVAIRSRKDIA